MRILAVVPDLGSPTYFLHQPLDLLYAAALLEPMHEMVIIDLRLGGDFNVFSQFSDREFDMCFLLTSTYDRAQCYPMSLWAAQETVAQLRCHFRLPIITMGPHSTLYPNAVMNTLNVCACARGEPEALVLPLVKNRLSLLEYIRLLGTHKIHYLPDINILPPPKYDLVPMLRYKSEVVEGGKVKLGSTCYISVNRGCSSSCIYCYVPYYHSIRYRSLSLVLKEIKHIIGDYGIRDFVFGDRTFTQDRRWVEEMCALLRQQCPEIRWICQTRVDQIDSCLLQTMRESGCVGIWYGVESLNISASGAGKNTQYSVIQRAINATVEKSIVCFVFVLIGFEKDTHETVEQTLEWLKHSPVVFSWNMLSVRPGTILWNNITSGTDRISTWEEIQSLSEKVSTSLLHDDFSDIISRLDKLPNNIKNMLPIS